MIEDDSEEYKWDDDWYKGSDKTQQEKVAELQEKNKDIVDRAYAEFFTSTAGQIIWADLCVQYHPDVPASISQRQMLDVNATLVSLGQHNVLKYIMDNYAGHDYSNSIKQRQEQLNVRDRANNIGG